MRPGRPGRTAVGVLLAGLAAAAPAPAQPPAAAPPLAALAGALGGAPAVLRRDFARIALEELALAYAEEARRAREGRRVAPSEGRPWRWIAGTEAFAAQLAASARALTPAMPVAIRLPPAEGVELLLAGRPVILSGPRIAEPDRLEARVLERFCARHDCEALLPPAATASAPARAGGAGPDARSAPAPQVTAWWTFSDRGGPSCSTGDGLQFLFRDHRDLDRKRIACAQVARELRRLAHRLAALRERGVVVQWDAFSVDPLPGAAEQHVRLNRNGDYLRLPLPALARTRTLLRVALPWLRAVSRGRDYQQTLPHAEVLLAPLLGTQG